MWQPPDRPRCKCLPRLLVLAAGLLTSVGVFATPAHAQEDPVEDLQQALVMSLEDISNLTDTVLNFRRENLQKKVAKLRTIGQLRRALALEEWKDVDTAMRKQVADKFVKGIDRVIAKGEPTAKMAIANLIAEIGPTIRAVDPNDTAGFGRSLTRQVIELAKDPTLEVQEEALRALGAINPRPTDAFPVFKNALENERLGSRRQAAAALGQLVRVVAFLRKRGRTASGNVAADRAQEIEVAQAAAAGASYGLEDTDAQVRRLCLEAIDEAAKSTEGMISDPFARKEFPPEGRPLTEEERKTIQGAQAAVVKEEQDLKGIILAFQKEARLIARNLDPANPTLAAQAAKALENIATVRVRVIRRALSAPVIGKDEEPARRKRLQAIDPLGFFLQDDNLRYFTQLLSAPEKRLRLNALEILELFGEDAQKTLPAITEALADSDRFVRWAAARAIGHIGPRQAPFAVNALAKLLNDTDDNVRLAASSALEAMGAEGRAALPEVAKAIRCGDAETRVAAMYVLLSFGAEYDAPAVPALAESLADSDARVRRSAADVLGKLGPVAESAVPALRKALEDDDQEVRLNASEALLNVLTPPLE